MSQAVMVAAYLVAQSKQFDTGVGGNTSIVVITPHGAFAQAPHYVALAEKRVGEFIRRTDELFLACADTALSTADLTSTLEQFSSGALKLHKQQIAETVREMLAHGINMVNDAVPIAPPGTLITVGGGIGIYEPDEQAISSPTSQASDSSSTPTGSEPEKTD
jgi:hypothetical protein